MTKPFFEASRIRIERPFFSICIPQYNRTSFLLEALRSLAGQSFGDFEVCISDDRSTDGREAELIRFLEGTGLSFIYRKRSSNGRYDSNLRAAIALARGRYCLLMGNDDALATPTTLDELSAEIRKHGRIGVALSNFEDFSTGRKVRRVFRTGIVGSGPDVAVDHFRNFSFVSGIALDADRAKAHATAAWDGSEMYQMFLGCRILAEGLPLLSLDCTTVRKDIRVPGESVDNYALRARLDPCPVVERPLPMGMIPRLVTDAVTPYLSGDARRRAVEKIGRQILAFTYPYWIVEYRRVQSWKYALGVCLGMRPRRLFKDVKLEASQKLRLNGLYGVMSVLGLLSPLAAFDRAYPLLHRVAKRGFRAERS